MIKVAGRRVYSLEIKVVHKETKEEGVMVNFFNERGYQWFPYDSVSWESLEE